MYFNKTFLHAFSRPARKNAANQNLLRQSFIAYIFRSKSARARARALLLTSLGVRAQESKSQSKRARARARALLLTSLGAKAQEREW